MMKDMNLNKIKTKKIKMRNSKKIKIFQKMEDR